MDENLHSTPQQYLPPALPAPGRAPLDGRDRLLLLFVFPAAYLFQELLRGLWYGGPCAAALGAALAALLTLGLLLWYAREKHPLSCKGLYLLVPALLVTLCLGLYAQGPLGVLNLACAPALLYLWALCACGILPEPDRWPVLLWTFLMSYAIRWKHIDKPVRAFASLLRKKNLCWLWSLAGALAALLLATLLIIPLLCAADAVFSQFTDSFLGFFRSGSWFLRGFIALCLAFLLYSSLYALRHDGPRPAGKSLSAKLPAAASLTLLAMLDLIYLLFTVIQFACLFGGAALLEARGLSYAEYARSGFFQLVFVALLNLSVSMLAITLTRSEGTSRRILQALACALLGMTAVILCSAAFRMHMYIAVYGLSVLRAMTLWAMALLAVWLIFAVLRLFRQKRRLFPFLLRSAVFAWAVLSLCNLNGLVARFNAGQYMAGRLEQLDCAYLESLGPAALPAVYRLLDSVPDGDNPDFLSKQAALENTAAVLEEQAQKACSDWRSWNLQSAVLTSRAAARH